MNMTIHVRSPTVVFAAFIVAGVIWMIVTDFGPVKLLAAGVVVTGVNALVKDLRAHKNQHR